MEILRKGKSKTNINGLFHISDKATILVMPPFIAPATNKKAYLGSGLWS